MRIVMLGHSGVGKTTYLVSAYGALQRTYEGFSMRTTERSDHERFIGISKRIAKGEYPAGTDQRETYQFVLRHNMQDVVDFDWTDYRGGALMDQTATEEAKKVRNDLAHADGVVVFCDAQKLQRGQRTAQEMGRLSQFLGVSLSDVDKELPVVVVLTKRDCVEQIDERITQWVDPIIQCLHRSERLKGALIPVACGPKASDVPLPLLFILCHGIQRKSHQLQAMISAHSENASRLRAKGETFFGAVEDAWGSLWENVDAKAFPYSTYSERAEKAIEEAVQTKRLLDPLVQPAKALSHLLRSVREF